MTAVDYNGGSLLVNQVVELLKLVRAQLGRLDVAGRRVVRLCRFEVMH